MLEILTESLLKPVEFFIISVIYFPIKIPIRGQYPSNIACTLSLFNAPYVECTGTQNQAKYKLYFFSS